MADSPTRRSLERCRQLGWLVDVVERWIPGANIRRDLFGAFDLVAIDPDTAGCVGIQTTSRSNVSARVNKLQALESVAQWLRAGNRVEVHGWAKVGRKWHVLVMELDPATMAEVLTQRLPRRTRKTKHQGELFDAES